jgi:hypothetical protein
VNRINEAEVPRARAMGNKNSIEIWNRYSDELISWRRFIGTNDRYCGKVNRSRVMSDNIDPVAALTGTKKNCWAPGR